MSVDSGYEPWARAAIDRGQGLTVEMGTELRDTIDKLRGRIAELEAGEVRTEWGMHFPDEDRQSVTPQSEKSARRDASAYAEQGAQLVWRRVVAPGPWTAATPDIPEDPS